MPLLDMIRLHQESGTRKFYATVPDEHILDQSYTAAGLARDKDYFRILLCEMFLRNKTNYISGFIPMALALNIFNYDGRQCDVPVLVGNQMLQAVDGFVKDRHIQFRNVPVIGPIPYTGADVSLFLGLYRMQVDNLAKSLFGLLDSVISAFNIADLSPYLAIVNRIGDGLAKLIDMPQIQMRFGTMDTFGSSANPFRDRYLLFINSPEEQIDLGTLWVNEGRLVEGATIHSAVPFSRQDYCLVRIEKLTSRPDIDTLPFHGIFLDSKARLWEGNAPEAVRLFQTLMRDLARSPDLTAEDRSALIQTYLANYQQEKENHAVVNGLLESAGTSATRSAGHRLSAVATIQRTASMAQNISLQKKDRQAIQDSLRGLAQFWGEIPHLQKRNQPSDLDKVMLSEQFLAVKAIQKDTGVAPEALAEAINFASFENP